jgi:hypothetical protein
MPTPGPSSAPAVRLSSPVDIAAALPHLLGFVPQASLVVLGLGAEGTVRVTGRADLTSDVSDTDAQFARMCRHSSARRAVLVTVVDAPVVPGGPLPATGRALAAARRLADGGAPVLVGLCLHGGRVWVYDAPPLLPGLPGWPVDGQAVPPADRSPLALARVVRGQPLHADRAALIDTLAPAPAGLRGQVAALTDSSEPAGPGGLPWLPPGAPISDDARARVLRTWARARRSSRVGVLPEAPVTACLLRALADTRTRDLILLTTSRRQVPESLLLAVHLLRCAGPGLIAPAGALAGWFAYLDGQGTLAGAAVSRALRDDPKAPLATLLGQALEQALPPILLEEAAQQAAASVGARIDPAGPLAPWRRALVEGRDLPPRA